MALFTKPTNGNSEQPMIDLRDVHKYYKTAVGDYHALDSIDLCIHAGEFVSIIGKSGSGKSTLLGLIAGLDAPTSGKILIDRQSITDMNEDDLAAFLPGHGSSEHGL